MENKLKISTTRYQQIAADIASRIANGDYKVGDKIYARSALASQYGVSPETARRAICVLSDLQIVDSTRGSGVFITSYENAVKFVKQHQNVESINELKKNIINSIERQKKEMEIFNGCLNDLIDKTERFRSVNPFVPFHIPITCETPFLNQSISGINFWHNTLATVVAIKRNKEILMSPGPYAVLHENDLLYFVGDDNCVNRVKNFLYPEAE